LIALSELVPSASKFKSVGLHNNNNKNKRVRSTMQSECDDDSGDSDDDTVPDKHDEQCKGLVFKYRYNGVLYQFCSEPTCRLN
jgi:hypothetical protein